MSGEFVGDLNDVGLGLLLIVVLVGLTMAMGCLKAEEAMVLDQVH